MLATGKHAAFVADHGFVALWLGEDEVVGVSQFGGSFHFLFGGIGSAEEDITVDCIVKQESVLRHNAHLTAKGIERNRAQINSVQKNRAALGVVKAQDEGEDRALACTAGTDECNTLPREDAECCSPQGGGVRPVGKVDMVEV